MLGDGDDDICQFIFFIKSKADESKPLKHVMVNEHAEVRKQSYLWKRQCNDM